MDNFLINNNYRKAKGALESCWSCKFYNLSRGCCKESESIKVETLGLCDSWDTESKWGSLHY